MWRRECTPRGAAITINMVWGLIQRLKCGAFCIEVYNVMRVKQVLVDRRMPKLLKLNTFNCSVCISAQCVSLVVFALFCNICLLYKWAIFVYSFRYLFVQDLLLTHHKWTQFFHLYYVYNTTLTCYYYEYHHKLDIIHLLSVNNDSKQ